MVKRSDKSTEGLKLPLVEEFLSIQGEGYHTGKPAYFIRLGGCDVGCSWCDTPGSWNHQKYPLADTKDIAKHVIDSGTDSVVVTGGEPLMWNLDYLCSVLKNNGMTTYLETSGAYPLSGKWDWICLSPKQNMPPLNEIYALANELKVIVQDITDLNWAENCKNRVGSECFLFLQPEWHSIESVIPHIVSYVIKNSKWRISLQIHKYMNIP